jgi:hypothetical protein
VPPVQTTPQEPQFRLSLPTSTQAAPQVVSPTRQVTTHFPSEQICPFAQEVPQPPQWAGSL